MNWDPTRVKRELRGPGVLVMAPFNADLSLNQEAPKRNIRYVLDGGLRTGPPKASRKEFRTLWLMPSRRGLMVVSPGGEEEDDRRHLP